MEGSIIEHGLNRQRKLDGLHAWYFLTLMDILQLLLQSSLCLFGCGLFGSFWQTNPIAVVVILVVILCVILGWVSVIVVGLSSDNCPYLSSWSTRPRNIRQRVRNVVIPRAVLELQSISWVLRTSLNEAVRLSAFKYLISIPELPASLPSLVSDCFHVFIACVDFTHDKVAIRQRSEQLATTSAMCLFRTFHHLSITAPTSSALKDLRECYDAYLPLGADFRGLPFHQTMTMFHILIKKRLGPGSVEWDNHGLSNRERVPLAWYMAKAAQVGYEETKRKKVPRWILRFALESLSLDPPSPSSVVANCLEIIATDLDCDLSDIETADQRYVQTRCISAR